MAKDKSEKKEKKEKKLTEENGVKKEKKEKKSRKSDVTVALNELEAQTPGSVAIDADGDVVVADADASTEVKARLVIPAEALVPFANPLADDKQTKKVLKGVKKGTLDASKVIFTPSLAYAT